MHDSVYELPYDYVYDFLYKVVKIKFVIYFSWSVLTSSCNRCYKDDINTPTLCVQIVHGIVRRFVLRIGHVQRALSNVHKITFSLIQNSPIFVHLTTLPSINEWVRDRATAKAAAKAGVFVYPPRTTSRLLYQESFRVGKGRGFRAAAGRSKKEVGWKTSFSWGTIHHIKWINALCIGASYVWMYDFEYGFVNDLVYDFLHKWAQDLIFDQFFMKS
jgi:hypothetical protein